MENQLSNIDAGVITNCNMFMNTAAIKQLSITVKFGFTGALATEQEDIVDMIASMKRKDDPDKPSPNKKLKTTDKTGEAPSGKRLS